MILTVGDPLLPPELYNGCTKKIDITRKRLTRDLDLYDDSKTLIINVKPGWKKGTKITFVNEGDEGYGIVPADLVFVIQEKDNSDPGFVRDGNNLVYTYKISLADALTDCSLQIPTLDQRILSLACPEVVSPFYEKLIPGIKKLGSLCVFWELLSLTFLYSLVQVKVCRYRRVIPRAI